MSAEVAGDADAWREAAWPLGARLDARGRVTVGVYAPAATRVTLELFDDSVGVGASLVVPMAKGGDGVWRAALDGVEPGQLYGFRCWGPTWEVSDDWRPGDSGAGFVADVDEAGNRFNPNKLLFDPYAREISHTQASPLVASGGLDAGMFGTGGDDYRGQPRRNVDTARWAPKGIIIRDTTSSGERPFLPDYNAAVYEAHVAWLTRHPASSHLRQHLAATPGFGDVVDVPAEVRGTYLGAGLMAPYLKALGVTTIELLPVQENGSSDAPPGSGQTNAWGYQTIGFFAPNRAYAHDKAPGGPTREFKQMVKAFHDVGLEVYLDVVYNHTGEGGNWAHEPSTTGFCTLGGFAAADYYMMTDAHVLIDGATGSSNQMNVSSAATRSLILDSLTYWADEMGVDGYRFDLATVLGRDPGAAPREDWGRQRVFFTDSPLLVEIRDFAQDRQLEVIAEAWDLWGYEVGNFPSGWGEWNGRFRDAVRRFLKGDGNTFDFLDQLNGDYHAFNDQGGPQRSINFVDAHDGFTIADLVSYNGKLNGQSYPFGPTDGGSDDNLSWDSGGDAALRRRRIRNFLTVLYCSRGVPMIVSGDEYGRTQNGNNNPWSLDTIGMWNNWGQAGSHAPDRVDVDPADAQYRYHDNLGVAQTDPMINPILPLAAYLANLRQSHPGLRQHTYGNTTLGDDDVTYLFTRADGQPPAARDRAIRLLIDSDHAGGPDLLVLINMLDHDQDFSLPRCDSGGTWRRLVDTADFAEDRGNCWAPGEADAIADAYRCQAWSVAVLVEVGGTAPVLDGARLHAPAPAATLPTPEPGSEPAPAGGSATVWARVADAVRAWLRRLRR